MNNRKTSCYLPTNIKNDLVWYAKQVDLLPSELFANILENYWRKNVADIKDIRPNGVGEQAVVELERCSSLLLKHKPPGYDTFIKEIPKLEAQMEWEDQQVKRHTDIRNSIRAKLLPYLRYREMLKAHSLSQTIIKEEN